MIGFSLHIEPPLYEEHFCYFFLFGPVIKEEMLFKDISYLEKIFLI